MKIKKNALCLILALLVQHPGSAQRPEEIKTQSGAEMILLKEGTFTPGDAKSRPAARQKSIRVESFYISKYAITQKQFQIVMASNPSRWQNENNPVERITWVGAAKFCNRLSAMEGLQPAYNENTWECNFTANGYRLPTEAEWEYAARGGKNSAYFFGDDPRRLRFFAWTKENSGGRTRPVGQKVPNPYGLYDVYGNVWEWCNDFFEPDYFLNAPEISPTGPQEGKEKVVRGGSWDSPAEECTSFFRGKAEPGYSDICTAAYDVYGFRIVRNAR